MSRFKSTLDHVRVAAPCDVDWDNMFGDEQVRFCGQCKLNVYNLSEMTKQEAELLVSRTEGRLCVRYYRRRDGSIITQNCPVGLRSLQRRVSRIAGAICTTVLSFFAGITAYGIADRFSLMSGRQSTALTGVMVLETKSETPPHFSPVMGDIVLIEKPKPAVRRRR
jgi:hypothetical protein